MHQYQDKYFDQDKNSILRAAQGFVEPQLLKQWVDVAFDSYMMLENPLGLEDSFILELKSIEEYDVSFLQEHYEILSAIYRYEKGNNQLEIIWDGRSHYEVYAENWSETFEEWIQFFCLKPEIYRSILKACILQQGTNSKFLYYAVRRTILGHFNLKIARNKMLKTA
ncbi:MAG: hypothetical protein RIC35_18030 [Marinoscillum sp.]